MMIIQMDSPRVDPAAWEAQLDFSVNFVFVKTKEKAFDTERN